MCIWFIVSVETEMMLDTFTKLRKATISSVMSVCLCVCPFVRIEQFGSRWENFHEIWFLSIFQKSVEKIKVSLKLVKITGTLHEDQSKLFIISRSFLLKMRTVTDEIYIENQNTNVMFNNFF